MKIACVGEVMVEVSPLGDDTARIGTAGDTFNTAVYLRRGLAEGSVAYVTALGDDAMSDRIFDVLDDEGLRTDCIERRADMMPGLYMISVDAAGERSFSYWRSAAAARTLFSEPCSVGLERLSAFDLVYISGISIAVLPRAMRLAIFDWAKRYRATGGTVAFDSNYRPRLWESVEIAREDTMRMWASCDIALPSMDDEMALFGDGDEAAVLARLASAGVRYGALKRGADGPRALDAEGAVLDVAPVTDIVDTTAAGDSFNAGFLAAYAEGAELSAAMRRGHDLAAQVIRHRGAILPKP